MRLRELAKATGLDEDTIRRLERKGVIQAERDANGHRIFDASAVALLRERYKDRIEPNPLLVASEALLTLRQQELQMRPNEVIWDLPFLVGIQKAVIDVKRLDPTGIDELMTLADFCRLVLAAGAEGVRTKVHLRVLQGGKASESNAIGEAVGDAE